MRKFKWTTQEQEYLKYLREEKHMKSWKQIASQLNQRFTQMLKTSKQCREKYINYSRFCGTTRIENNLKWSEAEDKTLSSLYNEFGSAWSSFTRSLIDKSQNSIKNRFYNRLKKLAKKLDDHRVGHSQQIRGTSSYDSMIRILDFSNQVKTFSKKNKVTISSESALIKTRMEILNCCFDHADEEQIPCQELCRLNRRMKEVNIKIRCFGICKAKNRKNWKLTQRGFDSTLMFDFQKQHLPDIPDMKEDVKIEVQIEKQEALQIPAVSSENEKEFVKHSTQNEQYLPYYHYYYMPPYFMMPPHMPMCPPLCPEYSVKLEEEMQAPQNVKEEVIKVQQK